MALARKGLTLALLAALTAIPAAAPASADGATATARHAKHRPAARIGLGSARELRSPSPCAGRAVAARARRAARRHRASARRRRVIRRRLQRIVRRCRRGLATQSSEPALPLYWGATIGDQITGTQAPWDMNAVASFEQIAGKPVSLVNFFAPFANCSGSSCDFYEFPTGPMEGIRDHGSIPVYSWASQSIPSQTSEPDFQLADTISGRYDEFIRRFAEDARDWGHPFFLRFNWEMNGNWFPWMEGVNGNQPGESVAAWRHVHDIFTEVGADNVTWVWCPNVDPRGKLGNLASLYPGDSYVDWTGLDGYNWGPSRGGWADFDSLYSSTYRAIADSLAPNKPMMIGEMGSSESGGSKAAWIRDALGAIPARYPKIRGVLWFDKYDDGMDWPIESSPAATEAFAAGIQGPAYTTNAFAGLSGGPILPPQ
jgi:mannan endo-1,4-beta-mannosidase